MIWLLILLLTSCTGSEDTPSTFSGVTMTIPYTIHIGDKNVNTRDVKKAIDDTFHHVNSVYNKWNRDSEVSFLNDLKAFEKKKLSKELKELFEMTDQVWKMTDGKFDPTIETIQSLWKEALEAGKIPNIKKQQEQNVAVGWQSIHWQDGIFWKEHSQTKLDFSGICKGLGVDLLVSALKKMGYKNLFVEWGGEIRTTGKHPQGRPWRIYLSRFEEQDPARGLLFFDIEEQSIATSGDYYQKWKVGNTTYCHIFDPIEKCPRKVSSEHIASASCFAPSCALADAIASSACLFSTRKEALKWAKKINHEHPSIKILLAARA